MYEEEEGGPQPPAAAFPPGPLPPTWVVAAVSPVLGRGKVENEEVCDWGPSALLNPKI